MSNIDPELRQVGLTIAYYRKLQGLSQLALAEKAGISRQYLSKIENSCVRTQVSFVVILAIARGLNLTPNDLLEPPMAVKDAIIRQETSQSGKKKNSVSGSDSSLKKKPSKKALQKEAIFKAGS